MSHSSSRALPGGKHFQHLKTTKESCSPVNQTSTTCKSFSHCDNIDGCHSHEHKLKRLKTRKQRSKEMRNVQGGHVVGAPRSKSHHHHTIKDMTHCNNRCQHRTHCPKRDAVFAQVFPAAKEPSIMTDCRLIGHRGLFNHEVKSIDIERLLSEQRKKEKVTLKQKTNMTTLHFPSSCLSSPGSSNDVAALSVEGVEDEAVSAVCTETQEVCLENEKMACHSNSQGSDITPGQKVLHQFKPSFESETPNFSFANSPTNALLTNKKKFKPIVPESARKPLLTPSGDKENTGLLKIKSKRPSNSSALEHGPNNQEPQHCVSSPVIVDLSSSPATGASDTFDTQQQGSGLDSMLTSISTMASRLCHSLQLPILKRRNLLAESREILLQALHERHGPQFQENLHSVQQCLSFTTGPSVDKGEDGVTAPSTTIYTDEACTTDTAFRVSSVKESHFDTQRTSLKGRRKKRGSNWRPPPPRPQKSIEQAAECMARPTVEKVGDLFDELLTPCSSSTFCIDFLPSETSSPHPTFGIPTVSNWEVSPPQPWENRLNNVRMRESAKEGCFKNSFLNHVREIREISSGPQQSVDSRHSSLHYSEGPPSTFRLLQQPQDLFEFDRYSRATSLCPQVCSPQESNQLHSFYHFNHPQTSSFLRSHYSNVMHYPPSHMIDRGPSPILPSLPSPEQGFFPPMRLY